MIKKIFIPLLLSLTIGFSLGMLIYNQYKNSSESVFSENTPIYFLQQGVYSSKESMEENTKNISDYIYAVDNNQYKVFVSINTNFDNAKKIKQIFNDKGIDIYIKELNITNKAFVEKLKQYDELISSSADDAAILGLAKQIISEYELVVKENN